MTTQYPFRKFSNFPQKFKLLMCTENPVLKEGDIDFECTNKDHHQICLEKDKRNTYLKG